MKFIFDNVIAPIAAFISIGLFFYLLYLAIIRVLLLLS
jgi:hypothetical protein